MEALTSWWHRNDSFTSAKFKKSRDFKIVVLGKEQAVNSEDILPNMTLNEFLRRKTHLTGTKYMCLEGGCGSCIVAATILDPLTEREVVLAVNSCLVLVYMCDGWQIHTVESIGNRDFGYHPIQKQLVHFNGTQCGFCTSGMIMNMYALYESGKFTMQDVENSFGGNICRCTGYRPILTAFKTLATDASEDILGKYTDIEDIPICKKRQGSCTENCNIPCQIKKAHFYDFPTSKWFKVFSVNEILDVFREFPGAYYQLVGGNTAMGVYKNVREPDVYIDIRSVKTLLEYRITNDLLILGANITLNNTINLFRQLSERPGFSYLNKMADHIELIAHTPVRNIGTLAGNLMIKHRHNEFPSDIYLIFETVAATLNIVELNENVTDIRLSNFITFDMEGKIIRYIILHALDESYHYESYKIRLRNQNAHAMVNAGFLFKFDPNNLVEEANIVYGGINPSFSNATYAENYLIGKHLFDNATIQELFSILDGELVPNTALPDPSPQFRRELAIALCYKFILSITPRNILSPRNVSGGSRFVRPISFGTQDYETSKALYPLTQPISKIEALAQCTGQAEYIMDKPDRPKQLYGAFVTAKAPAYSIISSVDASEALKLHGVEAFFDKNDIPGVNNFTPNSAFRERFYTVEELFCSGVVKYYFQQIGLIVANSQSLAEKAADMVQVSYVRGQNRPALTIPDVIRVNNSEKIRREGQREPNTRGNDVKRVIKGQFDIRWQYHFQMENQCSVVNPLEDGFDIYPSTQNMNASQASASGVLNIPINKINVTVHRVGGAYGSKLSRNLIVSSAAALASYKLQKPVKIWMPLTTNMNVIGKRNPLYADYEVGVNEFGSIQYLNASLYTDLGAEGGNENLADATLSSFGNMYDRNSWNVTMYTTRSDNATATWCRAPSTTEALSSAENLMQHIATELDLDPVAVRLENLNNTTEAKKYIDDLLVWADVNKRKTEVNDFNTANRWIKRGIAVVPMQYDIVQQGNWLSHVGINQADGSVVVAHAGIEMGQGINTKVAQVCAYALGIPLDFVQIKPSNLTVTPNAPNTGASLTTEAICYATLRACEILNERMKPVREQMNNPTWPELVRQCYLEYIKLTEDYLYNPTERKNYSVYGAACAEVEVDILTGVTQVLRVDIVEDTGNSISPQIDIGQVEGAFVMGMGYWTTEQLIFTDEGELKTNRTWTYKPPGAKDIPIDFRIKFPKNNPNPVGVLGSKATAEPPLCLSCSIPFAIRHALASARFEADPAKDKWYPINGPSTVENTFLNSLHDYRQYTL